ncbi:TonB-dependent receptor [Novosphingobium mangrovi (ex Huang et al. 2023)]|uniref:TonB-dependent siderophore receptor n=1 Tax=Novosphingobium mangrovi (ex Huang et al. 2023) TaxID=2976432 RepID=A0ABT2I0W3_9SPHN|nr:TonB-dependent siderophore receptor [Novosphingobium mangrovi (ex Huang et al. 2023)]MCT2398440.1 TonB-dependent siderophore receptor [Novosphingobium mangrovi (ex Huang et al. 2023)]
MKRLSTGRGQVAAGFVALGCVGFIATAHAQAHAREPDSEPTRLQGVSVTDTAVTDEYSVPQVQSPKATAPLVDTPRTVNVITDQVLRDTASFDFADALRTVPGITLGAGEGGTASADIPVIRGVDATSDTYVDGARDVGSQTRETFAVERIEVFKGPNSAFGGRGAAGGSINIVSKMPQDGTFANLDVTGGTSDFKRVTVDANAKLADKLAVRITGMWQDADVAGRDSVFQKRWGFSPSVTWGLGTDTTATLSYYHYETDDMPDYGLPLTSRNQLDDVLPEGSRRPADVDYDNFYGLTVRDFQKTKVDSVTFQFQHDFGGGWILSDTARWSHSRNNYIVTNPDDSAGNVAEGYVWRNTKSRDSRNDGLVNNLNLAGKFDTGGIKHSVAMGFELSAADTDAYSYSVETAGRTCDAAMLADYNCTTLDNPNPSDPWVGAITHGTTPNRTSVEDYSFYAFDTIELMPQLLLNGGVRWTSFNVRSNGTSRGVAYNVDKTSDFVTWQGGVVFKPTENSSLYFSYADSATPPGSDVGEGSNGANASNEAYKPSRIENWEVGGKADLFDGALSLTAAAFQIDRSNIQQDDGTGTLEPVANKARIRGFELGASGRAGPVTLLAGYTYIDSEIRASGIFDETGEDIQTGIGNALPNTPKHNVALTANVDVTDRFTVGGGAYHASKRYADTANLVSSEGYWRFDANAGFRFNENFSVRLNIRNLTDKRYIVKLRNPHFAVPGPGRQALITLSASY